MVSESHTKSLKRRVAEVDPLPKIHIPQQCAAALLSESVSYSHGWLDGRLVQWCNSVWVADGRVVVSGGVQSRTIQGESASSPNASASILCVFVRVCVRVLAGEKKTIAAVFVCLLPTIYHILYHDVF